MPKSQHFLIVGPEEASKRFFDHAPGDLITEEALTYKSIKNAKGEALHLYWQWYGVEVPESLRPYQHCTVILVFDAEVYEYMILDKMLNQGVELESIGREHFERVKARTESLQGQNSVILRTLARFKRAYGNKLILPWPKAFLPSDSTSASMPETFKSLELARSAAECDAIHSFNQHLLPVIPMCIHMDRAEDIHGILVLGSLLLNHVHLLALKPESLTPVAESVSAAPRAGMECAKEAMLYKAATHASVFKGKEEEFTDASLSVGAAGAGVDRKFSFSTPST